MTILKCPTCNKITTMTYDSFEDMYYCTICKLFYYPENVRMTSNVNAGYLKIGDKR